MNDEPENSLDRHMVLVALVISKLAETGLSPRDIDSERSKVFLGVAVDPTDLGGVLMWMVDEGIIRTKKMERHSTGAVFLKDAQLTTRGLATIGRQIDSISSAEKIVQVAGPAKWSSMLTHFLQRRTGRLT